MADLFSVLKRALPSLSDDDATKVTNSLLGKAPVEPVLEPEPSPESIATTVSAPSVPMPAPDHPNSDRAQAAFSLAKPAVETPPPGPNTVNESLEAAKHVFERDAANLPAAREALDRSKRLNVNDILAQAISMTPRGGRFASIPSGIASRERKQAASNYAISSEAAKMLQEQANKDRQFSQIEEPEALRKQTKFEQEQQIFKARMDPTSDESKLARMTGSFIAGKAGLKDADAIINAANNGQGATAEQLEKWVQSKGSTWVTAYDQAQQNLRAQMADARARELHEDTIAAKELSEKEKQGKEINKMANAMGKDLNPQSLRSGALGIEAKKANLAKHLQALATDQNGQLHNLTNIGEEELGMGLATMVGGGNQQAASTFQRVVPHYLQKDLAMAAQYLKGHPEILNDREFVKNFYDSAMRQGQVAADIIKEQQIKNLASHQELKRVAPEVYKGILDANDIVPERDIDEKGMYKNPHLKSPKEPPPKSETRIVNGKSYQKVPGGWREVE